MGTDLVKIKIKLIRALDDDDDSNVSAIASQTTISFTNWRKNWVAAHKHAGAYFSKWKCFSVKNVVCKIRCRSTNCMCVYPNTISVASEAVVSLVNTSPFPASHTHTQTDRRRDRDRHNQTTMKRKIFITLKHLNFCENFARSLDGKRLCQTPCTIRRRTGRRRRTRRMERKRADDVSTNATNTTTTKRQQMKSAKKTHTRFARRRSKAAIEKTFASKSNAPGPI